MLGRRFLDDGRVSPGFSVAAPATCPVALRARMRRCRLPIGSPATRTEGGAGASDRLDVHLEFCEVAIAEDGEVRSAGRIKTKPEEIELFAQSLGAEDRVALEVSGNAWEIKRLIEPHVAEVMVVSPNDTGIRQARAKTDRLDARTLARLLALGELDSVWVPDRATWMMRRSLQRRGQLVWARSRAKNQIHATLMRCLVGVRRSASPSGLKAGAGFRDWSSPRRSASRSTRPCARSSSLTPRSRRSRG